MNSAPKAKSFTESAGTVFGGKSMGGRPPEISAQAQGNRRPMRYCVYARYSSQGTDETVGLLSGRRSVEDIVQSEELFFNYNHLQRTLLHSLLEMFWEIWKHLEFKLQESKS